MSNQIEAIKLAVEWFDWLNESESIESPVHATTVHKVLKKALEQAITMAEQQAQQEPVAYLCVGEGVYPADDPYFGIGGGFSGERIPLDTTPPTPAQPLTDEQTDRELLELAAKAAEYRMTPEKFVGDYWLKDGHIWNPLDDDGDALRLAVKLGLNIMLMPDCAEPWVDVCGPESEADELYGDNPYAATRRAIVRAAAEIVKLELVQAHQEKT
jgi:hypothetical protein